MHVLVTGASGFIGRAIVSRLANDPAISVTGSSRTADFDVPQGARTVVVGELDSTTNWDHALQGVDVVIHTAARVHIMNESSDDALAEYRRVNVEGTRRLATQAAQANVARLIFLSSIKVNGEATEPGKPFESHTEPAPVDPYGISKLEAEEALFDVARATGLEVVVIRPPLVYGPGVGANFRAMINAVRKGLPLPFAGIRNQRSMVFVENLVDLCVACASSPKAPGNVFLVSDGEDFSTPDLLRAVAADLDRKARLFTLPSSLIRALGRAVGREQAVSRLTCSLQVSIDGTREILGWKPPVPARAGLAATVRYFREHGNEGL